MAQKVSNASEALLKAKEEDQDVFLARLDKEELERSGFDTSTFGFFEYVDIYLFWDNDTEEYVLKYQFDGDVTQTYYEKASRIGGEEELIDLVETYITLGGGEKA